MPKFAIYVVLVEDTEENDQAVGVAGESVERVGGNYDYAEAEALMQSLAQQGNSEIAGKESA